MVLASPSCYRCILSAVHCTPSREEMLRNQKSMCNLSKAAQALQSGHLVGLSLAASPWQRPPLSACLCPPWSISCPPCSVLPTADLCYLHCWDWWLRVKHQLRGSCGKTEKVCRVVCPLSGRSNGPQAWPAEIERVLPESATLFGPGLGVEMQ